METWQIKRASRDAKMRRALLKILQEATKESREGYPTFPEPSISDERVEEELHRILKVRKGLFR